MNLYVLCIIYHTLLYKVRNPMFKLSMMPKYKNKNILLPSEDNAY